MFATYQSESRNLDHIHHIRETSYGYGSYTNQGQHASGQGVINNSRHTAYYRCFPSNPLEQLQGYSSPSAGFDSAARFDPPRCTESTRLRISQIIEDWISSDSGDDAIPSNLFWLHGGAGVGKSALAQSLSEKLQRKGQLAASFFFLRSDPTRNNGNLLIPTLVLHLLDTFEGIATYVEDGVLKFQLPFTKNQDAQIRQLLIEPLLALKSKGAQVTRPRLIVIDGLDECQNADVQCELLRVIARAIRQIPYPLRFLVASRPEAHIARVFDHDHDLQAISVYRYNLSDDPDADMDIRKFLEDEFAEIRRVHSVGRHLSQIWPGENAITSLVERSSSHFIYASTVIRYIRSPKHRPDDRLEVILRLRPPQKGDRPYSQLDALYALIFQGVQSRDQLERICLVLGILYLQSTKVGFFTSYEGSTLMERLLEMKPGDLDLLLDPILSLVAVDITKVRIFHKSLIDYLLDFTRGGHLPLDLTRAHEVGAAYILKDRILKDGCVLKDFQDFAYHCQYAYLHYSLRDYLRCLGAPFPDSVMLELKGGVSIRENSFIPSTIWHFLRTLCREDLDSTGRVYGQYIAKWMDYLHSIIRLSDKVDFLRRLWNRKTDNQSLQKVEGLKRELDTLLMKWKPPNHSLDVGIDPNKRLAFIKQEHSIFSAYAEASVSGDTNMIASSLVFGDHVVHSYHFGIQDKDSFVIFQTYSRHGRACYQHVRTGNLDIVQETLNYLQLARKYLYSDRYQLYGLEPDEYISDT